MNSAFLQKVLAGFLQFAQGVSDFAEAEIPLYVKELLTYCYLKHMIAAWISLGLAVFTFVCCIVATYVFYHAFWKKNKLAKFFYEENAAESLTGGTVGSFFLSIVFILIVWVLVGGCLGFDSLTFSKDQFMLAYKAKNAPRVYVIDYLRENMPQKEAK